MSIIHTRDNDGSQTWHYDKKNAFIRYDPAKAGTIREAYVLARVGDGTFWCEDNKDFVYSFAGLVDGCGGAPVYMKRLAKRVRKDLATQGVTP
jgi:hypothetical protein